MNQNTSKHKMLISSLLMTAGVTVAAIIIGFFLSMTPAFYNMNNYLYDNMFRKYAKPKGKTDSVAIIEIDDWSLGQAQNIGLGWPWPRNMYAVISDYLINTEGAKAVAFDVLFTSPDIDRSDSDGIDNDEAFRDVMEQTDKVILAFTANKSTKTRYDYDLRTKQISNAQDLRCVAEYKSIMPVYEFFADVNHNYGFVDIEGQADGVIRQYKPLMRIGDRYYPALATAAYLLTNGDTLPPIRLNGNGNFIINWYGDGGYDLNADGELAKPSTFRYYQFWDVFRNAVQASRGRDTDWSEEQPFKDKVVFVGASARGLLDQKQTPFTVRGKAYPGVEIHATAYLNEVNQDWIRRIYYQYQILVLMIFLFVWIFFSIRTKSMPKNIIILVLVYAVIKVFSLGLFIGYRLRLNLVMSDIALLSALIGTLMVNYYLIGRNRNKIKNAFKSYLSPQLLSEIDGNGLTAGGKETEASAMFIDIAGFTTFSEKNDIGKVVEVLDIYLKEFSDVIIKNNGFVNKFLGDGLMALFGAPSSFPNHAQMAVKSAFECYEVNQRLSPQYGLNVRIGINSGKMICGNMGGTQRLEYTAIGDNVNLASRLEGTNKFFDTKIMVGENSFNMLPVGDIFRKRLHYIGNFSVKGKDIPIRFYSYDNKSPKVHELFDKMLAAFEDNDAGTFKKAVKFFTDNKIEYGPALFYIKHYEDTKKIGEFIKLHEK